jgi:hypothetical protein
MSKLHRIIAHWSAGGWKASAIDREHYHFIYENDGHEVAGDKLPEANVKPVNGKYAAHTLNCNTGSIGVAVAAMLDATPDNFGKYPVTEKQFDAMCKGIARLCLKYDIPVTNCTVLSHAEVQPTLGIKQRGKWDIAVLPFDRRFQKPNPIAVGNDMRGRVNRHMRQMQMPQPKPIPAPVEAIKPAPPPTSQPIPQTPPQPAKIGFWVRIGYMLRNWFKRKAK